MQQTQTQIPTPQAPQKRRRLSRKSRIILTCVVAAIITISLILGIIGLIPTIAGVSPVIWVSILLAILTVLSVVLAIVPLFPADTNQSPLVADVSPPSEKTVVNVNIDSSLLKHESLSSVPPITTIPSAYRHVAAQPPNTNPQTIQQREPVVKDVYAKLTQPNISVLVLTGIGGLGKSTLAALVYNYVEQQRRAGKGIFKRETLWLRVDEKTTFLDIAENLFTAFGNRPAGFAQLSSQAQAYAIVRFISTLNEPLLIVIDQFENLLNLDTGEALTPETGELLDALNSRPLPSRILLTSRPRPKGIQATTPGSLYVYPVDGLTLIEGQALLINRGVKGANEELKQAVERCKGHSLSLSLLASLLDENKLNLSTLLKDPTYTQLWDDDIATNLLNKIYKERLNDEQRELLQAYSIYREPVPQEAILPLISDNTKTNIVSLIRTLQAQQLIQTVEGGHRQLHPIVATYAQRHDEQFNKEGMHIAHGKAAQYYIERAVKQCPSRKERRKIADVQPLIEAVWQFCRAERWQEAYKVMYKEGLFYYVRLWGGNVILLEIGEDLLAGIAQLKPLSVANLYHQLGWIYDDLGKKKDALKYYEQALPIWRKQEDRKGESDTLNNLGKVYDDLWNKQKALRYYEQALAIRREIGDREGEGTTLSNFGGMYYDLGQKEEALQYYEQALTIAREVGNRKGEGKALNDLGLLYNSLEKQEEALQYYEQALVIRRGVGDRRGEGTTLWNIGAWYLNEERYDVALGAFILAQRLFVEVQSPDSDVVQRWIDRLQREIGDEQFAELWKDVEPRAEEIVEEALSELG